MDIALYGNLVIDTIFDNSGNKNNSLGGIANVWKAIKLLDASITVNITPVNIGSALIFIDKKTGAKISVPSLNEVTMKVETIISKISHIAYLNQLSDTSFIPTLNSNTICADLAGLQEFDYSILRYIDFLFIAHDEVNNLDLILRHIKGTVIVHSPIGSTIYTDNKSFKIEHDLLEQANVLGAGDFFAACFIVNKLHNCETMSALRNAHFTTVKYLKESYEE